MRLLDDWITRYLELNDNSEPPICYHLWTAIVTIAACMQRKCYLDWGMTAIYPNFYAILVGPPGGRKGTAMKVGKSMLNELDVMLSSDCVTRAQLVEELEEAKQTIEIAPNEVSMHCSLTVFSEEFAVFLGEKNPDIVVTLTDLFDCPDKWRYSTKNSGKNKLSKVFLNMIGATTPGLLQTKMTQDATTGGLISRIIFVVAKGREKLVPMPFPTREEKELYAKLLKDLEDILLLQGGFKFTEEAMAHYNAWYMDIRNSIAVDDEKFMGYNARRALHLKKLAMVMSASRGSDRIIKQTDFQRALTILESVETGMPQAFFGIGRSDHAHILGALREKMLHCKSFTPRQLVTWFAMEATQAQLTEVIGILRITGELKEVRNSETRSIEYVVTRSQNTEE